MAGFRRTRVLVLGESRKKKIKGSSGVEGGNWGGGPVRGEILGVSGASHPKMMSKSAKWWSIFCCCCESCRSCCDGLPREGSDDDAERM